MISLELEKYWDINKKNPSYEHNAFILCDLSWKINSLMDPENLL